MSESRYVYVTYIRTTAEKLWRALIDPEFTRQYWFQAVHESDWKPGSSWRIKMPDGLVTDSGEILESVPPKRLVIKWRNEFKPELKAEGFSRLTYEIEPAGSTMKLTVVHEIDLPESKLIGAVTNGWPRILASLKSLLETGESFEETRHWPKRI